MELATECYQLVRHVPREDRHLSADMLRTAVKIPSNIAGGYQGDSRKVSLRFLDIARGKVWRLHALLEIARVNGYFDDGADARARVLLNEIQGLLDTLIDTVRSRNWD